MLEYIEVLVVVGSKNSSNSNRLRELANISGIDSYLVDGSSEIKKSWFDGKDSCGVSAGASAPEYLVQDVLKGQLGFDGVVVTD